MLHCFMWMCYGTVKKHQYFLIVEHIGVYFFFRFVFLVETSNNIF